MRNIQQRLSALIDQQHQHPTGIIGRFIGERMIRQHAPETTWTLAELAIAPTDHVLEIGCGAGRGIALAAQHTYQGYVVGVDLSKTMVRAARARNTRNVHAGRATLLCANLTSLPFIDGQFDKIFSIHTFYFWPDPQSIITTIFHLLKPNGMLVLTLSTGRIEPSGKHTSNRLQLILESQVIPEMQRIGFASATLRPGPDSRQYTSVAVIARR